MTVTRRRRLLTALLLAGALSTGCNVLSVPFFLFAPEPKIAPQLKKLARDDKKETKVVILTYAGMEVRPELLRADRELAEQLAAQLREACQYNKENVKVVLPRKIEEFKNQHPDWKDMDLDEIGKKFDADWVIYLEIEDLGLYKKGSHNQLFQGRARVAVSLRDVNDPDQSPPSQQFEDTFPTETRGGAIEAGPGASAQLFREAFLKYVAKRLTWYFTAHPTRDDYHCQ